MNKKIFILILSLCLCFAAGAAAEGTGEYFFKDNISGSARLIDMHMLGAHDAFTAGLNSDSPIDAAGVKLGDSGSVWAQYFWGDGITEMSRAQSSDVEDLLNSGVRYFDVRLSRYISGGEFYTTHGRISDQFTGEGGIARKIAAWAANHPGEIIVLDFQTLFDIQSSTGGATADSWKSLMSKLESDGIEAYVHTRNGSISSITYDDLTEGGTRPAIVLFGQVTGSTADSRFINRNDSSGYVRSLWTEQSSYDGLYQKLGEEITNLKSNSNYYFYKFRVMQAQTTGSNLIEDANANNIKILTDENFDEWSNLLPIFMVDNATSDTENFNALAVEKLALKNREFTDGVYVRTDGAVTLTGNNENVPLNTSFRAEQNGEALTLSLSGGADITGEMTLLIKSSGKKQKLFRDGVFLGETDSSGWLKATIKELGSFVLTDTEEIIDFSVTRPLLWYSFTDESGLADISGSGLNAEIEGNPVVEKGYAELSDGNVLRLPSGLTKHMSSYTASAWIYMTKPTTGSRLFDIGRQQRFSVFAHAGTDKTSSGIKTSDSTTTTAAGSGLNVGEWTHIAASYSGGALTLYINGVKINTAFSSDPAPQIINDYFNPYGSFIGRTQWYSFNEQAAANPDINAKIADFRLYDCALSNEEIARLARKPSVKFIDIKTGEEIRPEEEIDIPTAYNGYSAPEEIDGYTLVKVESVTDMAGESSVNAYYTVEEGLVLIEDESGVTARLNLNSLHSGVRLILAAYNDGQLVNVKSKAVDSNETSLFMELKDGETYKAFLWEENMSPAMQKHKENLY